MSAQGQASEIVWNLKIRFIHWSLALVILINLFIFDEGDKTHSVIGYFGLALVAFRLFIGFFAKDFSAFKKFPLHPSAVFDFIKNLFRPTRKDYKGHNPMASYAYIGLWTLVILLAVTGFMLNEIDSFFGDEKLEKIHNLLADGLIAFLVVHFLGIALDSYLHKRKAFLSIVSGKK
jgi:cytochrome b